MKTFYFHKHRSPNGKDVRVQYTVSILWMRQRIEKEIAVLLISPCMIVPRPVLGNLSSASEAPFHSVSIKYWHSPSPEPGSQKSLLGHTSIFYLEGVPC